VAIAVECIHDMSRPVEALRAMRSMAGEDGAVLVVDERVGEAFTAPSDEIERLMYGFSIVHCLPVGMAEQPSAGTGTVMRPATLRDRSRLLGSGDPAHRERPLALLPAGDLTLIHPTASLAPPAHTQAPPPTPRSPPRVQVPCRIGCTILTAR
jgi:hypothetical protein